ncbi:MAG: tripartite tricarboxylate transporter substrate binding protein [Alphaproteobacteria bacterium]|nr:tripartite tricarboxylate transporter substrate binding protein [Alphaproteobacteria bacterium]
MTILKRAALAAAVAFAVLAALPASAQQWPTKPVKFIVPFPPGGSVDPLARLLGAKLGEALGQQFVVENRPGASGSLGAGIAARSPADGYTFLFVFDTHAVNPALMPDLPFNTEKDLAPVMLVGTAPMAIATNPNKPYKTFADVVAAAKAKPDTVTYGSVGSGSLGHLAVTLVQQPLGIKLVHVPYRGGGPMTQDALGGHVELAIGSVAVLASHIKADSLRAVVQTGDKRSHVIPDVPTLAESGLPGFSAVAWWGIFAPTGTPAPIMQKIHGELVKAINLPDVRKTLTENLGMDVQASSPADLQKFLASEMSRWARVIKENNIKAE